MRRFGTGTGFAFAKLSEVLPRSERALASVRMTDWASFARLGQDDGFFGCGDLEPVPASLARSCPRSLHCASFARFGLDDGL